MKKQKVTKSMIFSDSKFVEEIEEQEKAKAVDPLLNLQGSKTSMQRTKKNKVKPLIPLQK